MTFAIWLAVLSALGLVALLLLSKGHWFSRRIEDPNATGLQAIDVEAFRNLIDENEEAYLRENLPPPEFRRLHRQRMLAAVEYAMAAYRNAGVLVKIAEAAREATDPQVADAAGRLFDNAVHLRWSAARVIPRLYWSAMFSGAHNSARNFLDGYDSAARQALALGGLASAGRKG
jgi:hypothetical protein